MMASMSVEPLSFKHISLGGGQATDGKLKLHTSGIGWKDGSNGRTELIEKKDIGAAHWVRSARGQQLRLLMNNRTSVLYDGFEDEDRVPLADFLQRHFSLKLKEVEPSVKGWNWGELEVSKSALTMLVDGKVGFEVPTANIVQTTLSTNKREVYVEVNPGGASVSGEALCEMKFELPLEGTENMDAVDLHSRLQAVLSEGPEITGDSLCMFSELQCLVPRGRYDLEFYSEFVKMRGKTFDYSIQYSQVNDLFLLPKPDQGRSIYLVISLSNPLRQGATRYPFLVFTFSRSDEMDLSIALDETSLKEQYNDKLQKEMSGSVFEVLSRVFKTVTKRKLRMPGNFRTIEHQDECIKCIYKNNEVFMYPLDRYLVLIWKPTMVIAHSDIEHVEFSRVEQTNSSVRTFDMEVTTSSGTFSFINIAKAEYRGVLDYLRFKEIKIVNLQKAPDGRKKYDEHDSADDNDALDVSDNERKSGRGDLDSSSDDEDFDGEAGSSSGAEEYDSDAGSNDDDDDNDESSDNDSAGSKNNDDVRNNDADNKKRKKKTASEPRKKVKATPAKKKPRAKKDPNAPKRNQTSYFLWMNGEGRSAVKEQQPQISTTEISKACSVLWKEMSEDKKQIWKDKADIDKERYVAELAEYKKNKPESDSSDSDDGETLAQKKSKAKKAKSLSSRSSLKSQQSSKATEFKSAEYISSSDDD